MPISSGEWAARATMTGLGFSAGFFIVPLQVFLQARPPKDQKGRMIGAMNLVNWIAIVLSAVFYQAAILLVEFLELRTAAGPAITSQCSVANIWFPGGSLAGSPQRHEDTKDFKYFFVSWCLRGEISMADVRNLPLESPH